MSLDFEDFAYPPSGGWKKLVFFGLLVAGGIGWYALQAWIHQEAWWPAGRGGGRGVTVRGESARAMAVLYLSVAGFVHVRWFWGLLGFDRAFQIGTVFSLLLFLAALIWALAVT